VWCGVVWCGVVWCGVVWCGVVWCGVVWCGLVWCGVVWCGVVWCGVVWCGVVWCGLMVWCSFMDFILMGCKGLGKLVRDDMGSVTVRGSGRCKGLQKHVRRPCTLICLSSSPQLPLYTHLPFLLPSAAPVHSSAFPPPPSCPCTLICLSSSPQLPLYTHLPFLILTFLQPLVARLIETILYTCIWQCLPCFVTL